MDAQHMTFRDLTNIGDLTCIVTDHTKETDPPMMPQMTQRKPLCRQEKRAAKRRLEKVIRACNAKRLDKAK